MSDKLRVVLLSCGSFNPITFMHLRLFELSRDYLHKSGSYEVVGGIISPVNDAYKKKDLISATHRCEMVDRALHSSDWIKLDRWESNKNCWTRTVEVLEYHQNLLNSEFTCNNNNEENPPKKLKSDVPNLNSQKSNFPEKWDLSNPVKVMLLCGGDLLESFNVPDLWLDSDIEKILNFGLVVVTRTGSNPHRFIYESDILSKYQNKIHVVHEWITNEICSTNIRRELRRGNSVKYLVPDPVLEYIKEHNLYSAKKIS